MNKLYQKSEITFAILWIIIYVVGTSVADGVSESIGITKLLTIVFHVGLTAAALLWIRQNDLYRKYGLCKTDVKAAKFLYYIPLLVMVSCNLWFGVTMNLSVPETILYVISMICVGFLEELIFRGFLFKAMSKDSIKWAIIVSSVTFGIGHIVNLINGSGADLLSNLCQVCYAVAFGFLCVFIFYRGKSLWPCIAVHSAVNALSVFADETNVTWQTEIFTAVVLTIIPIGYILILRKTLPGSSVSGENRDKKQEETQ